MLEVIHFLAVVRDDTVGYYCVDSRLQHPSHALFVFSKCICELVFTVTVSIIFQGSELSYVASFLLLQWSAVVD